MTEKETSKEVGRKPEENIVKESKETKSLEKGVCNLHRSMISYLKTLGFHMYGI